MSTYVIAEIGQNHQGSVEIAKALIDMAADPRPAHLFDVPHYYCDAVKFTIRDLNEEGTAEMMAAPYDSPHSFGATYREHREALEFSWSELAELEVYARNKALDFVLTICAASKARSYLGYVTPDYVKVASRDLTNLPVIDALADSCTSMILSTGMASERDIDEALAVVNARDVVPEVTLMHCLSQYPAEFTNLRLRRIRWLADTYPHDVGYSDHSQGIMAPVAAVAMGATMIEKHVTLDRTMRGSDHAGSLERDGLWRMCRDIRNLDAAMGGGCYEEAHHAAGPAAGKLERSIATRHDLPAGHTITEPDLVPLSPGTGWLWRARDEFIGQRLSKPVARHTLLSVADLK